MERLVYHIEDENELKTTLHTGFLKIRAMKELPSGARVKLLSALFSMNPNSWRVIGITREALKVFKEHEFSRVSRMGINRSHIQSRLDQYKKMLLDDACFTEMFKEKDSFWNHYLMGDRTILATSSENMQGVDLERSVILFPPEHNLFRSKGFGWTHDEEEIEFLKKLYTHHI